MAPRRRRARPPTTACRRRPRATGIEVDRFLEHLIERLDDVGFFFPREKRPSMTLALENLFRRAPLTDADIRVLHGVVRALAVKEKGRK